MNSDNQLPSVESLKEARAQLKNRGEPASDDTILHLALAMDIRKLLCSIRELSDENQAAARALAFETRLPIEQLNQALFGNTGESGTLNKLSTGVEDLVNLTDQRVQTLKMELEKKEQAMQEMSEVLRNERFYPKLQLLLVLVLFIAGLAIQFLFRTSVRPSCWHEGYEIYQQNYRGERSVGIHNPDGTLRLKVIGQAHVSESDQPLSNANSSGH